MPRYRLACLVSTSAVASLLFLGLISLSFAWRIRDQDASPSMHKAPGSRSSSEATGPERLVGAGARDS